MAASLAPSHEYDAEGLYVHGPLRARAGWTRHVPSGPALPDERAPHIVRAALAHERRQARRRASQRQATPAPRLSPADHPRRCKKAVRVVGRVK